MGTIVGVVIGYVLGTRSGDKGWQELEESWKVIRSSEEVRDLLSGALSMLRDLVQRGGKILAGAREAQSSGSSLRQVA
jgi:hypothetical protein